VLTSKRKHKSKKKYKKGINLSSDFNISPKKIRVTSSWFISTEDIKYRKIISKIINAKN